MEALTTGYYSLIQYCPDRSRLEAANIGVLLFVPALNFMQARIASGNDRIRRFFHDEVGDLAQINLMKRMLAHRIDDEAKEVRTVDELKHLLTRFANELVFSAIRPIRVENPTLELTQLFEELVGGGRARKDNSSDVDLDHLLRTHLETAEFSKKVYRNTKVRVPILGEELTANYSFQNGRLNLIQTKEFNQHRFSDVMREAMKAAVDGHLLYKHPDPTVGERQLVIVGEFGPTAQEQQDKLEQMLADHEVTLYSAQTLNRLVQRIRETAH